MSKAREWNLVFDDALEEGVIHSYYKNPEYPESCEVVHVREVLPFSPEADRELREKASNEYGDHIQANMHSLGTYRTADFEAGWKLALEAYGICGGDE